MTLTVAITGVTGFIGRHILDNLLARGFNVRGLTRSARADTVRNLTWVQGSLESPAALSDLVQGADVVIHCAGQVRGHREEIFTDCNVAGSVRLMQAACEGGSCRRFLFMSSLAARHPELSWYAHSKYVAEQQLMAMSSDIVLGIFRPTAVYGPGDKELKPVFDWLLRGVLPRVGTPDARLSFLHVNDLADAVCQWLTVRDPVSRSYEVCDGLQDGYSWDRLREIGSRVRRGPVRLIGIPLPLLKLLSQLSGLSYRVTGTEPMLTRSKLGELTHPDWSASNQSLSECISWTPKVSLEHALRARLF